ESFEEDRRQQPANEAASSFAATLVFARLAEQREMLGRQFIARPPIAVIVECKRQARPRVRGLHGIRVAVKARVGRVEDDAAIELGNDAAMALAHLLVP